MARAARVLLVDDEEELRELISFELQDAGYEVVEAGCGNDAMTLLKTESYDFVISDIRMPRGDGVSLLKWIVSELASRPKVFLMTGFAEVTREQVVELGAEDLLEKPFLVRGLVRSLSKLYQNLDSPSNGV
jgi:DNA-binding response OmpR family regulator